MRRGFVLKILFPLYMLLGALFKDKKESLQSAIINLNNRIIERSGLRTKKILLLLPHCLQIEDCEIRITSNVRNCKGCGKCRMKGLIEVADRKGIEIFVATGGNLARRIVTDVRPEAIVAVACERDLSSGIADVYPMPVYGVWNERPNGPCINTSVNLDKVEQAIDMLAPDLI